MAEPFFIELNKDGDFDGVTPMTQTRDDFTVSGQRYYKAQRLRAGGHHRLDDLRAVLRREPQDGRPRELVLQPAVGGPDPLVGPERRSARRST
jgi:hypothetical protein